MDLSRLFTLQFVMLAEMAIGYVLCKRKILQPKERSVLSRLVVNILLPCNIIHAFRMEMNRNILIDFLEIFLLSCGIQVLCSLIARFAYQKVKSGQKEVLQFATVCSNAGFLGNAVAEGIYGQTGLMYGQIYLIPLRIVMWTAGITYFAKNKSRKSALFNVITHPCIIAVIIGLIRMIFQIPFPAAVDSLLSGMGACATPLIMVFLGMILAEAGFSNMLTKLNLIFSGIRLFLIPVLVLVICILLHLDPLVSGLSVILAAMPAGTTTAVVAQQYNADVEFAANCVVLTTVLSILLLPAWVIFLSAVL